MPDALHVSLDERAILRLSGPDLRDFLQGIVSNDVHRVSPTRAIWAAFLTPQGKYLHDFFIIEKDGSFLLECEAARRGDLLKRLRLYRLRSQVELEDVQEEISVHGVYGKGALDSLHLPREAGVARDCRGGMAFVDPRRVAAGVRLLLPRREAADILAELAILPGRREDWERLRIAEGLPDGSRDMEVEKAILLENGFDELGGVDWQKGCYMGQELTARTKYRGLVKKRLVPVEIEGPTPPDGTPLERDGREVGILRSTVDGLGLALLRLEHLEAAMTEGLKAGNARAIARKPEWVAF